MLIIKIIFMLIIKIIFMLSLQFDKEILMNFL